MGCWNETDALTQLPILAGAPVKVFILVQGYEAASICYCSDAWEPLCFPISGKYDDYGMIEDIKEDWNTAVILAHCNKLLQEGRWQISERGKEMAKYDKEETSPPYASISMLLHAIEREYLVAIKNQIKQLSLSMMHDEIYEAALAVSDFPDKYRQEIVDTMKETVAAQKRDKDDNDILFKFETQEKLRKVFYGRHSMQDLYMTPFITGITSAVEDVTHSLVDFARLVCFMENTRRHFAPQSGKGSQGMEFKTSADFLKMAYKFAAKQQKKIDAW
jgi:hypothetical protein